MDQKEKELVKEYLQDELNPILEEAKRKALRHLNGGKYPKKKRVSKIQEMQEYPECVKAYTKELDKNGYTDLLAKESEWDAKSLHAITTSAKYIEFRNCRELAEKEVNEKAIVNAYLEVNDITGICIQEKNSLVSELTAEIEEYFQDLTSFEYPERDYSIQCGLFDSSYDVLLEKTTSLDIFFTKMMDSSGQYIEEEVVKDICGYEIGNYLVADRTEEKISKKVILETEGAKRFLRDKIAATAYEYEVQILHDVCAKFDKATILDLMNRNPALANLMQAHRLAEQEKERTEMSILDHIPDKYIDLYPAARNMHRRFVLHIGPTNSGKTYDAIKALEEAGNGVYLAPLRLLAYEQYEKMNADGFPCSLLTGEERADVPGASFTASTIEMANYGNAYAAAVIDEAQMINDNERGGSWTSAILGIRAEEIHVCMSENAESVVIRLIQECGDDFTIVRHERKTPLICEGTPFNYPQDVQDGDALIVFSRRNVHAVAAELQKKGFECSVIYGALPYTVRHRQAELFASGKHKVVVATDAIGMGMNLPIRRVVFLEQSKFDGQYNRPLLSWEYKQIAGRAGRLGMYDEGRVTSFGGRKNVRKALETADAQIEKAVIAFPEVLIGIDAKLSTIIKKWIAMDAQDGYRKAVAEREAMLCRMMEASTDNKRFIYRFITIPFDEKNENLLSIWNSMYKHELGGTVYPVMDKLAGINEDAGELQSLEEDYRICDLLYTYCDRFAHPEHIQAIQKLKDALAEKIADELSKKKLKERKCKYCGRILPWNYPYGMCQKCHDRMYPPRYNSYWEDGDDWNEDVW